MKKLIPQVHKFLLLRALKPTARRGFTFVELLLYMAVVSILLTSLTQLAWNAIGSGIKNATLQEVYANARFVSEKIKYEIRNASGTPTVLATSISYTDQSGTPSTIDLSGGKIRMNKGSPVPLNSDSTTVTSLTFTNYSSADTKTKHIGFVFTIEGGYAGERYEFQETISMRGSAEVRSN